MPAVHPVGAVVVRGEQLALSTTVASLGIPPNCYQTRLYVPSTNFRLHVNPKILGACMYDASAAAGSRFIAFTQNLTDRDTGTGTGSSLNSMATGDYIYVGFADTNGGLYVTVGNDNANGGVMAVTYYDGSAWSNITPTDNTTIFSASGTITWTAPTTWPTLPLDQILTTETNVPSTPAKWVRISTNTAADSTTSLTELWTLNKDTNRVYCYMGQEYNISFDLRQVGAIEAILASGTDTMDVSWVR